MDCRDQSTVGHDTVLFLLHILQEECVVFLSLLQEPVVFKLYILLNGSP